MPQVRIEDIRVGNRMRKDLGDLESLMSSLARIGQLQPIVLTRDNVLLAGGRRYESMKQLGWELCDVKYVDECDAALAKEIELEENLRRKDLHWTEEVLGLEELVRLKQERYGKPRVGGKGDKLDLVDRVEGKIGYSFEDAGRELDRTATGIGQDLVLARALREYPEIGREATKSAALNRYKLMRSTALREEQARRQTSVHEVDKGFDEWQEKRKEMPEAPRQVIKKTVFKDKGSVLYWADSRDVVKFLAERHVKVDCIVTDPPFGLGLHKEGQSTSGSRLAESSGGMYDDDPHAIMDMLDQVFMWAGKILKEDGHAYVFFHHTRYEETFNMLRKNFGTCEETPICWIKNTPGVGDPNRNWVYAYEPCFFINRGRNLISPQAFNYLKYDTIPGSQKIHPTEKPSALLRHIINASCVSGELVLDPFSGSGSTLVAADQVGCKFIGIERDERFYRASVERLSERIAEHQEKPEVVSNGVL